MSRRVVRYSEAFKLQVVSELESGVFKNIAAARERYDIRGCATVQGWLKKYGRDHLRQRIIRVESPTDRDQIKALKKRVSDLEKALAATQVNAVLSEAYYHVVCEEHGIKDPEEYKKKLDTRR